MVEDLDSLIAEALERHRGHLPRGFRPGNFDRIKLVQNSEGRVLEFRLSLLCLPLGAAWVDTVTLNLDSMGQSASIETNRPWDPRLVDWIRCYRRTLRVRWIEWRVWRAIRRSRKIGFDGKKEVPEGSYMEIRSGLLAYHVTFSSSSQTSTYRVRRFIGGIAGGRHKHKARRPAPRPTPPSSDPLLDLISEE